MFEIRIICAEQEATDIVNALRRSVTIGSVRKCKTFDGRRTRLYVPAEIRPDRPYPKFVRHYETWIQTDGRTWDLSRGFLDQRGYRWDWTGSVSNEGTPVLECIEPDSAESLPLPTLDAEHGPLQTREW